MNVGDESDLEMVERHVREAEEHVARQREIVERLPLSGDVAEMARTLLADYELALSERRAHLARLQGAG